MQGKCLTKDTKQPSYIAALLDWLWARTVAAILLPLHMLAKKIVYSKIHSSIGISKVRYATVSDLWCSVSVHLWSLRLPEVAKQTKTRVIGLIMVSDTRQLTDLRRSFEVGCVIVKLMTFRYTVDIHNIRNFWCRKVVTKKIKEFNIILKHQKKDNVSFEIKEI